MATSLQEIHEILDKIEMKHKIDKEADVIVTGFMTENYKDSDDDNGFRCFIQLSEEGKFCQIIAPELYTNLHSQYEMAILQTCMYVTLHTKMVQCIYDESNKKVLFAIDIPLEDNNLSFKQLMRAISYLVVTVDEYDQVFRSAINTGEFNIKRIITQAQQQARLVELVKNVSAEDLERLIQQLELSSNIDSGIVHGAQRALN